MSPYQNHNPHNSNLDMEITIRPYKLSDVDDFMAWACTQEVLYFSKLGRWLTQNSSREQVVSFFSDKIIPHPWYRAICLNSRPIGFVCVEPGSAYHRGRGLVSYALGRDYWGKGIATAAMKMAVSAAFKELPGLLRIEAFVDPGNSASERVLEKVGFLREGFLRQYLIVKERGIDVIMYSILSTDPIGKSSN